MSVRTLSLALLFPVLLPAAPAGAQTLWGRVVEAESGLPLVGVEMVVLDGAGQPRLRGFSDTTGRFFIDLSGGGRYRVRANLIGYQSTTSRVLRVAARDEVEVQIRMGVEAIPLDPIHVVTRRSAEALHLTAFNARRLDPGRVGGFFLTREDIERRPAAIVSQLVLQVPGASLRPINNWGLERNAIRFRGRGTDCNANLFVDGAVVNQSGSASIDDLLEPSLVAGVEVYPRPSAAPIEYRADTDCGIVLFWTTRPGRVVEDTAAWKLIAGGGIIAGVFLVGIASMAGIF